MSNFTNLKNTYLYGKENRKNNYFQKYKNYGNNIDDPIFTGFTFAIDLIHSPLFYGNYESNSSLASIIETNLKNVWTTINGSDKYDILSFNVKNVFSDGTNIGYGLQENTFGEELLYGATDYIYMVDKNTNNTGVSTRDDLIQEDDLSTIISGDDLTNSTSTSTTSTSNESSSNSTNESSSSDNEETKTDVQKEIDDSTKTTDELIDELIQETSNTNSDPSKVKYQELTKLYEDYDKHVQDLYKKWLDRKSIVEKYDDELQNIKNSVINSILNKDYSGINSLNTELDKLIENTKTDDVNVIPSTLSEVKDDKNTKKELAKNYLNEEKNWKKIKDKSQVLLLQANIDTEFEQQEEYDAYMSASKDIRELNSTLNEYIEDLPDDIKNQITSFADLGRYLSENPSNESYIYSNIDDLSQKINDLNAKLPTLNDDSDSPSTDNSDTITSDSDNTNTDQGNKTNKESSVTYIPPTVSDIVGFKEGLQELCEEFPYVFLSVSGLDNAYKKYYQVKDSYYGSGDDTISIECLESLDMKVSSTFNKYLNAVYDRQYRRERVPVNLRRFNCSIFVHDIRNFREALSNLKSDQRNTTSTKNSKFGISQSGDNVDSYILELALNYLSVVEFKFFECEIIPEETGNIFDSVNNESESDNLKTHFTFKYGNCVINFLPFRDLWKHQTCSSSSDKITIQDNFIEFSEYKEKHLNEFDKNIEDLTNSIKNNGEKYKKYWDRSELGNVNNDDYNEYIRRDNTTAANDFIRNQYSDMFVNNSIGKIQSAATELDNILHRTILGISASVGAPPVTIADAMGVNDIWNPKSSSNSLSVSDIMGVDNSSSNIPPIGISNDLGNTNTQISFNNGTSSDLNYTSSESKGITKDIGNMKYSTSSNGMTDDLKSVSNDSNMYDETKDLGDISGNVEYNNMTDEIGDIIDDITYTNVTSDLNHVYDNPLEMGSTNEIGDVIDDVNSQYTTTNLNKLNDNTNSTSKTTNIGDIDTSGNMFNTTEEIGHINGINNTLGTTTDIGDIIDDIIPSEQTSEIGILDVSTQMTDETELIGKLNIKTSSKYVKQSVGHLESSNNFVNITSDLGTTNNESVSENITEKIGKYDLSSNQKEITSNLGKQYFVKSSKNNKTKDLGQYDLSSKSTFITQNLNNNFDDNENISETVYDNLGQYDLNGNYIGKTKDLGKYDLSSKSENITDNLGQYDLNGNYIGKTKDLGKYDLSPNQKEITSDLGNYNTTNVSSKNVRAIGENVEKNTVKHNIQDLGSYTDEIKTNSKTTDLGKYDITHVSTKNTENLGNYNLDDININGSYKNLGKFDDENKSYRTTENIGKFKSDNSEIDVTKKIDYITYDSKVKYKTQELDNFNTSHISNYTTQEIGKNDDTPKSKTKTSNLGQYDVSQKQNGEVKDLDKIEQFKKEDEETKNIGNVDNSKQTNNSIKVFSNLGNVFRK